MENCSGLMHSFLNNRYQRIALNGQSSYRSKLKAAVPVGSFIKDLVKSLYSNVFADDSPLFSGVRDPTLTTETLSEDLTKIYQWALQ